MTLHISSEILNALVQKSKAALPEEACGLLFGVDDAVSGWIPTANVAAYPARHFEIDPATLIAALRAERDGGEQVIGYWHSHPSGDARPSTTDADSAAPDGRYWLIIGTEVLLWRAVAEGALHGRFDPIAFDIV